MELWARMQMNISLLQIQLWNKLMQKWVPEVFTFLVHTGLSLVISTIKVTSK